MKKRFWPYTFALTSIGAFIASSAVAFGLVEPTLKQVAIVAFIACSVAFACSAQLQMKTGRRQCIKVAKMEAMN